MSRQTTFSKLEPLSKRVRVVASLKEAILSGRLPSGEQIVEGKIAQQFGVGQGLIREALIELEHQGFVQRIPFSGTQVTKLGKEDAVQIFDIRIVLEPMAFELAGQRANSEQLDELWKLTLKAKQGAEERDLEIFFKNHLAYRRLIWELSGNRYLQQTLERLVVPLMTVYLIRGTLNRDGLIQTIWECIEHQEQTVKAFKNGDVAEAKRVVREFLVHMKENLGSRLLPAE